MRGKSLVSIGLTVLLVLSVFAVGGLATESQDATELTQCTTITEPGSYELTTDLTYSGSEDCIVVAANDVTINGNGHSISYDESGSDTSYSGQGISVSNRENVIIRGVAFEEHAMLDVHESTAITIENNRFNESAIIDSSRGLVLEDNYFSNAGAHLETNENVRITNNRIENGRIIQDQSANVDARGNEGSGRLDVDVRKGDAVVTNNSLFSISVGGYEGTTVEVTRNHVVDGGLSVIPNGVARVHNNTVEGRGMTLGGTSDDFVVTHNTITGADIGAQISGGYDGGPTVVLERNVITGNRIGVETASNLPEIHRNDLSGNSEFGVVYTQDNGVVNATHNFWGDRPSSPADEHAPFEDPETGALADGSGSAVSEGSAPAGAEPGVSNVQFDLWLDTAPDAGVQQSSDGDGPDQTTTTTATTTTTTNVTTTPTTTNVTTTTATTNTTTTTATTTATTDGTTTTGDGTTTTAMANTTTATSNETTATPTTRTPTVIETTSETTPSEVPGFGYLGAVIALLASALLVARHA